MKHYGGWKINLNIRAEKLSSNNSNCKKRLNRIVCEKETVKHVGEEEKEKCKGKRERERKTPGGLTEQAD